ncbi:hypothetical protein SCHPADRAFT_887741 [Schizopora paradoxa]|uniref:MYND-type domain-containing protein n=1 Tax=Schizopora paradoxa TaxID=27342 RepID=A0A0H2SHK6_9AGAM|nr:hypothetical protein SCHPADRAFT_887741 [Schizopora paradoxa]
MSSGSRNSAIRARIPLDLWTPDGIERLKADVAHKTREVIKAASRGFLNAVFALAGSSELIPAEYRQQTFSLYLDYLWNAEEKFQDLLLRPFFLTVIFSIFYGLYTLIECVDSSSVGNEAIDEMLLKDWANIAHWIKRFCDTFKSKDDPFPGETLGLTYKEWYTRLVCTLTGLAMRGDMKWSKQVWADSDARLALYHLWFHDDRSLDREFPAKCSRGLTAILQHDKAGAFKFPKDVDGVASELIKVSRNGKEGIAKLAVSRLIAGLKNGDDDLEDTCEYAQTVWALVVWCNNRPLSTALLEKQAVIFLTKMFVKFARLRLELEEKDLGVRLGASGECDSRWRSPDVARCVFIVNFLESLDFISSFGTGCPYIRQALHHDILHGIIACTSNLTSFSEVQDNVTRALTFFLGYTIPVHLAYYSVILELQNAMESVDEGEVERWVLKSPVRSEWIKFQCCLLERMVYKAQYLKSWASEVGTATCGQCQKKDDKGKFKKCAGCQTQHYCSKECQVKHWKFGGHREVCKEMDDDMRGGSGHHEGRMFLNFLTKLDVYRHKKSLDKLAAKKYGVDSAPPSSPSYVYSIQYTFYPPVLGIYKIGDEDEDSEEKVDWKETEELKEEARLTGGEIYLFKTLLPSGSGVIARRTSSLEYNHKEAMDFLDGRFPSIGKRPSGVDSDGNKLHVTGDMADIVLLRFPPEMRSGEQLHKYWKNGKANTGPGDTTLAMEISKSMETMFAFGGVGSLNFAGNRQGRP